MRERFGVAARVLFGVGGAVFLVIAFATTWDPSEGLPLPGWGRLGAAILLVLAGLACAFRAWARLLDARPTRRLATGFYLAQFGKYVPGGVWHAVGQVGYATRSDVSLSRAATAFGVFAVTQAAAGGAVGATAALLARDAPPLVRGAAAGGVVLVVLLDRRWMARVVGWMPRRSTDASAGLVPSQRAIVAASAWSAATLLTGGAAFALILSGIEGGAGFGAVPAFALAWTVGFLALPFPSGVGVREIALIALLGGAVDTSSVIAASVFLRLSAMVGEALMTAGHALRPQRAAGSRRSNP